MGSTFDYSIKIWLKKILTVTVITTHYITPPLTPCLNSLTPAWRHPLHCIPLKISESSTVTLFNPSLYDRFLLLVSYRSSKCIHITIYHYNNPVWLWFHSHLIKPCACADSQVVIFTSSSRGEKYMHCSWKIREQTFHSFCIYAHYCDGFWWKKGECKPHIHCCVDRHFQQQYLIVTSGAYKRILDNLVCFWQLFSQTL